MSASTTTKSQLASSVAVRKQGGRRVQDGLRKQSAPGRPLVTIMTVVRNGQATLEQTIQSVVSQTYANIEYIVIDGLSTDGTLDIIRQYEGQIAYWISEPDQSIFDAMNKGISAATGDWLLFLGADDRLLEPSVIEDCISCLSRSRLAASPSSPVLVYGDVIYSNGYYYRSALNFKILLHNTVHHQAALYSRQLFDTFRYDVSYRRFADYELNLLIYLKRYPAVYLGKPLAFCQAGGSSSSNRKGAIRELNRIRRRHVPYPVHVIMVAVIYGRRLARLMLNMSAILYAKILARLIRLL